MTTVQPSALNFEQSHVHQVYDLIAQDFSRTRHTRWPFVETFLESLPPCSVVLDAGCGNGKYLGVHSCVPCDYQPLRPKIGASSDLASNGAKDHSVTPALLNIGLDMSRGLLGIAAERGHEVVRADCYDSAACFRPGTIVSSRAACRQSQKHNTDHGQCISPGPCHINSNHSPLLITCSSSRSRSSECGIRWLSVSATRAECFSMS